MSASSNGEASDIGEFLTATALPPPESSTRTATLPRDAGEVAGADIRHVFTNYFEISGNGRPTRVSRRIREIAEDLFDITGGFPKRLGPFLFARSASNEPLWLEKPSQLFAWIESQRQVVWHGGPEAVPQDRLFAYLQMYAEHYEAIELAPHWPPLRNTYYLHPPLPPSDGSHLSNFLRRFAPADDDDRQLMRGLAMSLFWGGLPGDRPAWLITGSEDGSTGRGHGKSSVAEWFGNLAGGFMEFSPTDPIEQIKKRLLSPGARQLRVARLDNIKASRFSWSDLEGLVTSPVISGHRMFKGEGRRPNTLTWIFTINGPAFSSDLSQRTIQIKLACPRYSDGWKRDLDQFLTEYRWHVIADIGRLLTGR